MARLGHRVDDLHRDVRAAKAVDEPARLHEAQLRDDVVLHHRRGRRRQRQHRGGAQLGQALAEHAVLGAEVVAPLRDAVGLVDGDERRRALREHLREAGHPEALGREEQEVELAGQVRDARGP